MDILSKGKNIFNLFIILMFFSISLFGDTNIFSPGKLSKYHKDLDGSNDCMSCHIKKGGTLIQKDSCYKCHTAIKKRVENKKGFHNTAINKDKKNCADCHKEHFGDRYELVTWPNKGGHKKFNHDLTGYKLKGTHKKNECEDCHKKSLIKDESLFKDKNVDVKRTYLGLGTSCVSCHPNDLHKEEITNDNCASCHNENAFKDARIEFDHNLTKFELRGQHKSVSCESCHKPMEEVFYQEKWRVKLQHRNIKHDKCIDCHKNDDNHDGKFGETCESCHKETSFNDIIFDKKDHAPKTFPLTGKHLEQTCQSCHTDNLNEIPKSTTCISCHKKDEPHRMKFGETCENCHTTESFNKVDENKFNHDLTGYILEGYHRKLDCAKCHSLKGTYKEKYIIYNEEKGCKTCHQKDNPHKNDFDDRNCNVCHNQDRFAPSEFTIKEHNKTEFILDGSHEAVSCNQCHKSYKEVNGKLSKTVLTFKMKNKNCVDCHNTPHIGQFEDIIKKDGCEKCHTTSSFHEELFDHNKDTNFKLVNSHKEATCKRCHEYKVDKKHEFGGYFLYTQNKDKDCSYCHTDIHYGQFKKKKCADCHNDISWDELSLFDHNRDTKFKLDGKHAKIECEDCHKDVKIKDKNVVNYKIKKHSCIDCHDSYHKDKQ